MNGLAAFETNSVAQGYYLADEVLKTAEVELIEANAICAGKFLCIFTGSPAALLSSLEGARSCCEDSLFWRSMYLARAHEDLLGALCGGVILHGPWPLLGALGVLESYSALASLSIADQIAKAYDVTLLDLRLGRGLGGKSTLLFSGEQAKVELALSELEQQNSEEGHLSDLLVIARPDEVTYRAALPDGPGYRCRNCYSLGG